MTVTADPERQRIVLAPVRHMLPGVRPDFLERVDRFIKRYRPTFEALAQEQALECLTLEEVLLLHARLIRRTGGSGGVHDMGLLESALARPWATFEGQAFYPDLWNKAAALMQSLIRNHAFVDGDRRTASSSLISSHLLYREQVAGRRGGGAGGEGVCTQTSWSAACWSGRGFRRGFWTGGASGGTCW